MIGRRLPALAVAALAVLGCDGCSAQTPTDGPLQTVSHVGSVSCESALGDPDARFILAETFRNSGTTSVEITSGRFEHPVHASRLGPAVALGHVETVNSWRLPFGTDQPDLAALWRIRTPIAGTSLAPGDSLQIALPIALRAGAHSASAGPIEISYVSNGTTAAAVGVAELRLAAQRC